MENFTDNQMFEQKEENQPKHQFTPYLGQQTEQIQSESELVEIAEIKTAHQFTPQSGNANMSQRVAYTLQVPEYTAEQIVMQENIKKDAYGFLKMRESLKVLTISLLIILGIIFIFNLITFVQLSMFGFISGVSISFFSSLEIFVIRFLYASFLLLSIFGLSSKIMLLMKLSKIRVMTIPRIEHVLSVSMLLSAFQIAFSLFLSAFWLMTNQTGYLLFFIFQATIISLGLFVVLIMSRKMEQLFKRAQADKIPIDDKPKPEIEYYKPIGYKTETRYMNN